MDIKLFYLHTRRKTTVVQMDANDSYEEMEDAVGYQIVVY